MQTLLLLLLSGVASAHMPVFDGDLVDKDIHGKSWAIYKSMKAGDNLLVRLNVSAGQNISFSVNMAGSQSFEEGLDYVNVTVTGHNAQSIDCDPAFNGWRVLSGTHEPGVVDQTKVIPTTTVSEALHFEPFSVGYYRKLAACQSNVTVGDVFNVSITAKRDIQLNVGVGMAEMFSFTDIVLMSISITRTWFWDNYFVSWVVITVLIPLFLIYVYRELVRKSFVSIWSTITFFSTAEASTAFVRATLFFNAMQFLLRLIIINLNSYAKDVDLMILFAIGVHICLPLAVAWVWGKVSHSTTAYVILLIYSSALLWQGFFIIPAFCVYKIFIAFRNL